MLFFHIIKTIEVLTIIPRDRHVGVLLEALDQTDETLSGVLLLTVLVPYLSLTVFVTLSAEPIFKKSSVISSNISAL